MRQIAPDPDILFRLVERLVYKPGWSFYLEDIDRDQGSEGLTLRILVRTQNSYDHKEHFGVNHLMIVPAAAYDERSWRRWLLEQILLVERHEACEFFTIDGEHVFGPHHGPGNDPYIIFEFATREETRVDYRGES